MRPENYARKDNSHEVDLYIYSQGEKCWIFDYYFLNDFFNNQYKDDQQFARIFSFASMLAIMIACLGLWGLASFTTTQKLKGIGVWRA